MAEQPMIEISQNDNLERVIRICNTNFRAISANSKISTGTISDDVAREMAAMAQAFSEELDSEARIRASADDDLEDMITGLDTHFLPITGGTITGNLGVNGSISNHGEQFYVTFKTVDHTQYTPVTSPCFVLDTTEMMLYYYDNNTYTPVTSSSSSAVTGVKGNEELTYRTGDVNLTPANIGALDEDDYLAGLTWDQLEARFTWDDLASGGSQDATTANLNLVKPSRLSTVAFNGNMDILDTAIGGVGSTSLQSQIDAIQQAISSSSETLTTTATVTQGTIKYVKFGKVVMITFGSSLKASASWTTLATLPVALRPEQSVYAAIDAEGHCIAYIGATGLIQVSVPNKVINASVTYVLS